MNGVATCRLAYLHTCLLSCLPACPFARSLACPLASLRHQGSDELRHLIILEGADGMVVEELDRRALPPLVALHCDLAENLSVLALLDDFPDWSRPRARRALLVGPKATLSKWAALTLTLALLVRLLVAGRLVRGGGAGGGATR